jgi:hypothetical protein
MEETKSISSATDVAAMPNSMHHRGRPDVPEDVDFLLEHLNDPNLDLKAVRSTYEIGSKKPLPHYTGAASDIDTESHIGSEGRSTSRAESRYEAIIDFEKYVFL